VNKDEYIFKSNYGQMSTSVEGATSCSTVRSVCCRSSSQRGQHTVVTPEVYFLVCNIT